MCTHRSRCITVQAMRIYMHVQIRSHGCGCTRCCGRKWKLSAPLPSIARGERERRPPILRCIRARASFFANSATSHRGSDCNFRLGGLHASNSMLRVLHHPAKYSCDRCSFACLQDRTIRILHLVDRRAFKRAKHCVTFHNS